MYGYNVKRDGMVNWNLVNLVRTKRKDQTSDMQTKKMKNHTK